MSLVRRLNAIPNLDGAGGRIKSQDNVVMARFRLCRRRERAGQAGNHRQCEIDPRGTWE
jgi:hypothetical protein